MRLLSSIGVMLAVAAWGAAQGPSSQPPIVPIKRPEMLKALEDHKSAKPRLPLPPLTEEEKASGKRSVSQVRMRVHYLDPELLALWPRDYNDKAMSLPRTLKTEILWITSRTINCHYCLGHQESILAAAGFADEKIAALDCDWSAYTEQERAAFTLARKLTYEPHRIGPADFQALRRFYTEMQTFEIIFWIACYNLTNRWTEALSIPLEAHRDFKKPVAAAFRDRPSLVAPLAQRDPKATPGPAQEAPRPPLETRAQVEAALDACRKRTPYLELAEEKAALALLPHDARHGAPGIFPDKQPVANWMRLLAHFPKAGGYKIRGLLAEAAKGKLDNRLKAQISWICARHDRAWYALGQAKRRLLALGVPTEAIYALDGKGESLTDKESITFAFIRKLTAAPANLSDDDIAQLRKHYSDSQVAEIVYRVGSAGFFNRVTEACGLPLEQVALDTHGQAVGDPHGIAFGPSWHYLAVTAGGTHGLLRVIHQRGETEFCDQE
jgi:alkylhydroperoxidase family enzyme